MILLTGIALASAPVQMQWTEQSAANPSIAYHVNLYGLGEDADGDGLIDEVALFYQVTTLENGQAVMQEEGLVQVGEQTLRYSDVAAGRTVALSQGLLVLDHGEAVEVTTGDVWLFEGT